MPTLTNSAVVDAQGILASATRLELPSEHLRPYVQVLDKVLRPEFCDQLIAEFAESDEWQLARAGMHSEVNRDVRNVDAVDLSHPQVLRKNPQMRQSLEEALLNATRKTLRHYQALFPSCRIVQGQSFELLRYRTGGFYRTHTDSFKKIPRTLSCSYALNDDFEGGDWSFFHGEYQLRLPKGSVVVFPSNFMFPHEILEVKQGTRYAVVTWMI